jgi:hypothetical protein
VLADELAAPKPVVINGCVHGLGRRPRVAGQVDGRVLYVEVDQSVESISLDTMPGV